MAPLQEDLLEVTAVADAAQRARDACQQQAASAPAALRAAEAAVAKAQAAAAAAEGRAMDAADALAAERTVRERLEQDAARLGVPRHLPRSPPANKARADGEGSLVPLGQLEVLLSEVRTGAVAVGPAPCG
jgi:hypothetical protein